MIRAVLLKTVYSILSGAVILVLSGLAEYKKDNDAQFWWLLLLFTTLSFILTQCAYWITQKVRKAQWLYGKRTRKILGIAVASSSFSFLATYLVGELVLKGYPAPDWYRCIAGFTVSTLLLSLVYEVLFLSKEKELMYKKVISQGKRIVKAEVHNLSKELDPHFLFNSLATLSYLISKSPDRAQLFTEKLTQVYKYLLMNKDKELISLQEELEFIHNYFFLLRIRYENKIVLHYPDSLLKFKAMIPPCSLQLLVENAIKHNQLTSQDPLVITISINHNCICVENKKRPRKYAAASTKRGLLNLNNRYQLLFDKEIEVCDEQQYFTVRLPLIKFSVYEKSSHY